jgi:hypothetical protein
VSEAKSSENFLVKLCLTAPRMELSTERPTNSFSTFRKQKTDTSCPPSVSCQLVDENDIIDFSKLRFRDDENWLCDCSRKSKTDLTKWLYFPDDDSSPDDTKLATKSIDTRTFTRPKKRFTRPSIEKYNEELYGSELKELTDSGIQLNGYSLDESPSKPLHFDLAQPTASVYFENILANAPMMDSFQNMSPPSLVNSMCSSTFATLMENSFIKNDPVLREIRDTDFTGSILQQEAEPMFQSITESYSSLNSDVPENFLKKVSFNEKSGAKDDVDKDATITMNATFAKEDLSCDKTVIIDDFGEDFQDAKATSCENLNSTYQRKPKSTNKESNSTFQRRKGNRFSAVKNQESPPRDLNSTITIESEKTQLRDDKTIENIKRLLDRRPSPSFDLNRLSYLVDKNDQHNATFPNENHKRNSFGSTDSGENLDYMSLSSGSSKNSSKVHSTDRINMIVDMQERQLGGLHQIMSTPKPRTKTTGLWLNHEISPIRDRNSDPEMSSSEQPAKAVIPQNSIRKQKSVGHINQKIPNPKSVNTLGQLDAKGAVRGSHPNLRLSEARPYGLQRPSTNLNSMGHTLKGSYTSLKPINPNLPVAPPPLDSTMTITKNPTVVAQVSPVPREIPAKKEDAQFVKPQQPPRSGLPRPITGIPRPVSRIPGPKKVR